MFKSEKWFHFEYAKEFLLFPKFDVYGLQFKTVGDNFIITMHMLKKNAASNGKGVGDTNSYYFKFVERIMT